MSRAFERLNVPTKKILIIDDDDHVRSTLAAILLNEGYRVITAGNVSEAMETKMAEHCDLVLLDLNSPVMDGCAFLTKFKSNNPELPVVILTDYSSPKSTNGTEFQGVRAYFIKPVDPGRLLDCVKVILMETSNQNNRFPYAVGSSRK